MRLRYPCLLVNFALALALFLSKGGGRREEMMARDGNG